MRRLVPLMVSALLLLPSARTAVAAPHPPPGSPWLATPLAGNPGITAAFVPGSDIAAARQAVGRAGLDLVTTWDRIAVAVARGTPAQIAAVRSQPGVSYVEGD